MIERTKDYMPCLKNDEEQLYIERGCLSSILLNSDIPEEIEPVMFHFPRNQTIFTALKELKKVCVPDLNILCRHLQEKGELEKAGGIAYIAELTNLLPSPCNIGYYVDELMESYHRRSVMGILSSAQNELALGKPLDEITEQISQRIHEISIKRNHKKLELKGGISFNDLVRKQFPQAVWIVKSLITVGLTLLIGGSKIGKSWLALQLAIAIDKGGYFR